MRHLSLYQMAKGYKPLGIYVVSLGCPKNLVDTEEWLAKILGEGKKVVDDPRKADLIFINTCSFIQPALEESLGTIAELTKTKSKGKKSRIIVAGCLVERLDQDIRELFPEVDICFGVRDFDHLEENLREWFPHHYDGSVLSVPGERVLVTPSHLAYVRVADGCDRTCTFCSIPGIRGKFKSRPLEELIAEVENLAQSGVFEAVLIAHDTNYYGKDLYGEYRLADLIRALSEIENLGWLRLMYFYPEMVTDEILGAMASSDKVCKYIDIPLQHVSRSILKRMTRKGDSEVYVALLGKIRQFLPGVSLRSTFMVGFPGETEENFKEMCEFVQRGDFNSIATFPYYREEDTSSARLANQIPEEVKAERLEKLRSIIKEVVGIKLEQYVGKTFSVLIDGVAPDKTGYWWGRWEGQAPDIDGVVYVPRGIGKPGELVKVKLNSRNGSDFMAEPV